MSCNGLVAIVAATLAVAVIRWNNASQQVGFIELILVTIGIGSLLEDLLEKD